MAIRENRDLRALREVQGTPGPRGKEVSDSDYWLHEASSLIIKPHYAKFVVIKSFCFFKKLIILFSKDRKDMHNVTKYKT